jgi:hypothetical protein
MSISGEGERDKDTGSSGGSTWRFVAAGLAVAALAGGYLAYRAARGTEGPAGYRSSTTPSTQPDPTSRETPSTAPLAEQHPTTTFIDVVRAMYPTFASTKPLDLPVRELTDAARIVMTDPVYLGPNYRADLWITRSDGLDTEAALKRAMDAQEYPQVHVLPERVRFVHWNPGAQGWSPFLVCDAKNGGGLEVVSQGRRETIAGGRKYDWSRAASWNQKVVVPSETGVSIFGFDPKVTEDYRELMPRVASSGPASSPSSDKAGGMPHSPPQALLDWQGLLAWIPSENGKSGSRGAARYVDDKWVDLGPEQGWPEQILHLIPLRDGSVVQMVTQSDGGVRLAMAALYEAEIDEAGIKSLLEQLADADSEKRDAAFKNLSQYGPGIFPILERLAPSQPPEARSRIRALLRNKMQPTLGGITLAGDKLRTVSRHDDGGVVLYAEEGVSISRGEGEAVRRAPAWLSIRPGHATEVLDEPLVKELKPESNQLIAFGTAPDWVVAGDAAGPRRWIGNDFVPFLNKEEQEFTQVVGIDRKGRWLFRKPGDSQNPETLIVDPTLPDPKPKLPFWEFLTARAFGWDAEGWPVVRREGGDWSLRENGWKLLDQNNGERLLTEVPPSATRPAATSRASIFVELKSGDITNEVFVSRQGPQGERGHQGVAVATTQSAPLLTDDSGTAYYDGLTTIEAVYPNGLSTVWPLPPAAVGKGPVTLIKTADGLLFLFNQPGRVLRIRPTPGEAEPFKLEATFTRRIPSVNRPKRIWLDPAGRIVVVDARRVILFFPQGFIPPRIRDLMPVERSVGRPE